MGIEVYLDTPIQNCDGEEIRVSENQTIKCQNFIWAAGVSGETLKGFDSANYVRGNRLKVDRFNKIAGMDSVFAVGDIAYIETDRYPKGHPQVAQVAIQQANVLAKALLKNRWILF